MFLFKLEDYLSAYSPFINLHYSMFLFKRRWFNCCRTTYKIYITVCFYLNIVIKYQHTLNINLHYSMFLFKLEFIHHYGYILKFTLQYVSI